MRANRRTSYNHNRITVNPVPVITITGLRSTLVPVTTRTGLRSTLIPSQQLPDYGQPSYLSQPFTGYSQPSYVHDTFHDNDSEDSSLPYIWKGTIWILGTYRMMITYASIQFPIKRIKYDNICFIWLIYFYLIHFMSDLIISFDILVLVRSWRNRLRREDASMGAHCGPTVEEKRCGPSIQSLRETQEQGHGQAYWEHRKGLSL
jgi:hypothetical protein